MVNLTKQNIIRLGSILLAVVSIAGIAGYCYQNHTANIIISSPEENVTPLAPEVKQQMKGVKYDGSFDGKKTISIITDEFKVQNKKIGFVRFGLMSELFLKNARLYIYGEKRVEKDIVSGVLKEKIKKSSPTLSFKNALSKSITGMLPVNNIGTIVTQPVSVIFYDENEIEVSAITAENATVRLRQKDILFYGNVRIKAGNKKLAAGRLRFVPETSRIYVNGKYVLSDNNKETRGEDISSDLYLALNDLKKLED